MSRFTVPDVPPSLNRYMRLHWAKRKTLSEDWMWYLHVCVPFCETSKSKARVKITLMHSRLYDKDNAYGSVKVLIDAMKKLRMIVDDSAEWLELTVEQGKCPHKQRHTIIELEAA